MNRELYIVEGTSAASALRQALPGRSPQQVWSMRGKLPNVSKLSAAKIAANARCQELTAVLTGAVCVEAEDRWSSHSADQKPDPGHWDAVYVVSDADVDGQHASILLIRLIVHLLPEIINSRRLFIISTPLFKVACEQRTAFAYSETECKALQTACNEAAILTRYKSVAQLSPGECAEVVFSSTDRRAAQLSVAPEQIDGGSSAIISQQP